MKNIKVYVNNCNQFSATREEWIQTISSVGFDGFFHAWTNEKEVKEYRELADSYHLVYHSIHAPTKGSIAFWEKDEEGEEPYKELFRCVECAGKNRVPIVVVHPFTGFFDREERPTQKGLDRLASVVAVAKNYGVKIAFENLEGVSYLDAVMQFFKNEQSVGFCFDSGHAGAYAPSRDFLKDYGERLLITHLHDNFGMTGSKATNQDDLHLLPFDGTIDWDETAKKLANARPLSAYTFELKRQGRKGRKELEQYIHLSLQEYYRQAFTRAKRTALLIEKYRNALDK